MNQEDIIRMAREAGLDPDLWNYTDAFERFADLAFAAGAAAERSACANLADAELLNTASLMSYPPKSSAAWNIGAAIRARSKQ